MQIKDWPDVPFWQESVQASSESTFFHTPLWHEIVVKTFKNYTIATKGFIFDDGSKAVLPLIQTKAGGLLRGRSQLKASLSGCYGGVIAANKISEDRQNQIYDYITSLKANVSIGGNPFAAYTLPDTFKTKKVFTQLVSLTDADTLYRRLSKGAKYRLKQAQKKGVTVRTARTEEDIAAYFAIYQDTLKRWGDTALATYPEELFFTIFRSDARAAKIWLAEKDGRIIAGAVRFYWNHIVFSWHNASLKEFFDCAPNNMLLMETMKDALAKKYRWYDFAPSAGIEGVVSFKRSFGAEKREFMAGRWKYSRLKRV